MLYFSIIGSPYFSFTLDILHHHDFLNQSDKEELKTTIRALKDSDSDDPHHGHTIKRCEGALALLNQPKSLTDICVRKMADMLGPMPHRRPLVRSMHLPRAIERDLLWPDMVKLPTVVGGDSYSDEDYDGN